MRRVQDLTTARQHSDTLVCSVVNVSFMSDLMNFLILKYTPQWYLRVQLAMIAFENEQHSTAADQLTTCITTATGLFSCNTPLEPKLQIFSLVCSYKSVKETSTHR